MRSNSHLKVHDIRGNLNTRLAKLDADNSKYAGIVLAQAGLVRLGWLERINQTIEPNEMLYAVGQGALAVECRASDKYILEMLQTLVCHQTQCRILAERSFLKTLGGGCSAPVAVHSTLVKTDKPDTNKYKLHMIGSVWSLDGKIEKQDECECELEINEEADLVVERQFLDEDDAVPPKRMKIDLKIDQNQTPESIDHLHPDFKTHDNTKPSLNKIEIVETVQKDVRKNSSPSCPISTNKLTETEAKSSFYEGTSSKCPLNFSVGQEVMGQCPYSVENNQILIKSMNSSEIQKIGCPFKHELNLSSADISKCPLFNKSERNSDTLNRNEIENFSSLSPAEPLFCGIYQHRRWPLKVFEQCEQLGKKLANKLIEKGAILVMESAQNEIRSSI